MKVQIRRSTFETNSSSTHSIAITTASVYDEWISGKLLYDYYNGKFITAEEAEKISEDEELELLTYEDFFGRFCDDYGYEAYEEKYTTPGGEKVIAFGIYGWDN